MEMDKTNYEMIEKQYMKMSLLPRIIMVGYYYIECNIHELSDKLELNDNQIELVLKNAKLFMNMTINNLYSLYDENNVLTKFFEYKSEHINLPEMFSKEMLIWCNEYIDNNNR